MGGDRERWDARYAAERIALGPAAFLVAMASRLPRRGRALDVACGSGRQALFLAEHGLRVTGIDVSPVGLALAARKAKARGLALDLVAADLTRFPLRGSFDVVSCFHYLDRALFPALARAVAPGGVLIFETFTRDQLAYPEAHPRREEFLLAPNELLVAFPGLHVVQFEEGPGHLADGSRATLARLLAERR